jgi:hypothetical protein
MAAPAAFNAALQRLGFNDTARAVLVDADRENLNIDNLKYFDDDGIQTLCQSLRKPGGTVQGQLPAGAAVGTVPPQVPNPGVYVSAMAERNLKVAAYIARHFHRTGRTLAADYLTAARIHQYVQHLKAEEDYKEPEELLKLSKVEKVWDFIDDFPEHLALYDGQGGRPLSYIIREIVDVPAEAGDPTFGEQNSPYTSIRDEIINRSAHGGAHYALDNARVFKLLNESITALKHVKAWIKPYEITKNGRQAWLTFVGHYRGSSELETIQVQAENRLDKLLYRGEKPRYNFETHVSFHRKSHNEISKATGIELTEQVKVRKLLTSLQTPTLLAAIATIRAQENLRNDFDETVNYLRAFISNSDQELRVISRFGSGPGRGRGNQGRGGRGRGRGGRGAGRGRGNSSGTGVDRWYTVQEWYKLDDATKEKVRQEREKRRLAEMSAQGSQESSNAQSIAATVSQRSNDTSPKKKQK